MYNKISIVGGSGSGKSTLCRILSQELNLPAIHLDALNFSTNWVQNDISKRNSKILEKISEKKWIIDGNYDKTLQERFDNADLIIFLDYSTLALIKGVSQRFISLPYKEKPEVPGCKERLNFKFFKYVISFNKKRRPIILEKLENIPKDKVLIFNKRKDLNNWLIKFTNDENILNKLKTKR